MRMKADGGARISKREKWSGRAREYHHVFGMSIPLLLGRLCEVVTATVPGDGSEIIGGTYDMITSYGWFAEEGRS